MKKRILFLLSSILIYNMVFSVSSSLYEQDFSVKVTVPSTESKIIISPQPFDKDLTSVELTKKMGNGINLGNTLEAYRGYNQSTKRAPSSYETLWGQPEAQPRHFEGFARAGFKSVRIPIAWTNMMDYEHGNFTIAPAMLDRVEEVVNMANNLDKKSFNEKDLYEWCNPIEIEKKKLKVNYRYNVEKFLHDTKL